MHKKNPENKNGGDKNKELPKTAELEIPLPPELILLKVKKELADVKARAVEQNYYVGRLQVLREYIDFCESDSRYRVRYYRNTKTGELLIHPELKKEIGFATNDSVSVSMPGENEVEITEQEFARQWNEDIAESNLYSAELNEEITRLEKYAEQIINDLGNGSELLYYFFNGQLRQFLEYWEDEMDEYYDVNAANNPNVADESNMPKLAITRKSATKKRLGFHNE